MTPRTPLLSALLLAATGGLLFAPAAFARDSTCLLGDNGKIAVTTLEHRAGGDGTHRVTDITLIFGAHLLRGHLRDADSGPVTLVEAGTRDNYKFVGTLGIDYDKMKMTLKGKLKYDPATSDLYNTTFDCKQLQPN
jgi:hypothetical protein